MRCAQTLVHCAACRIGATLRERGKRVIDLREDGPCGGAAVADGLAANQIVGLDGGGAFIDRQDARIAVVLRCTCFLDKAHAAVHLHA
ncbi:hypothetical protein D3C85_1565080 [compost metagenome]